MSRADEMDPKYNGSLFSGRSLPDYQSNESLALGLSLGFGVLVISLVVMAVVILRQYWKKQAQDPEQQTEIENRVSQRKTLDLRFVKGIKWSFGKRKKTENDDSPDAIYDYPSPNPVPVRGNTPDCDIYDRPSPNPVPVRGNKPDYDIYARPSPNPVPVRGNKPDCDIYARPSPNPVPVRGNTPDYDIYARPSPNPVPVRGNTPDYDIYDRPPQVPIPVNDDNDNPIYDRPPQVPIVVDGYENQGYDLPPHHATPVDDNWIYDRPPNVAIPVGSNEEDQLYDRLPVPQPYRGNNRNYKRSPHVPETPTHAPSPKCPPRPPRPPKNTIR